jgi:hypothetical protein
MVGITLGFLGGALGTVALVRVREITQGNGSEL